MSTDWAEPRTPQSKKRAKSDASFDTDTGGEHGGGNTGAPLTDAARKRLNNASSDGGFAKCMASGVRLLAGRDYSVLELTNKLARRFNSDVVAAVIHELSSQNLVDDARYAEAFCRSRVERGYGPGFILRELQQNGLDPELIESVLSPYEEQWLDRAVAQVRKSHRPVKTQLQRRGWEDEEDPVSVDDADAIANADVREGEGNGDDAVDSRGRWGRRGSNRHDSVWQQGQKERGRLARMLARRGFSGALAGKAIDWVLKEESEGSSLDFE